MEYKKQEELEAHLARYGIAVPEDTETRLSKRRAEVQRHKEKIMRRIEQAEQEAFFWQERRKYG